jgi:hypothetical protein
VEERESVKERATGLSFLKRKKRSERRRREETHSSAARACLSHGEFLSSPLSLSLCVSFREQLSTESPVRSALTRAQRDRESRDFWENGKEKEEESGPSVPSSARGLPF